MYPIMKSQKMERHVCTTKIQNTIKTINRQKSNHSVVLKILVINKKPFQQIVGQ